MGQYNSAVITAAGSALISQAIAGQLTLQWTKAQLSSHQIPSGTDLTQLTSLQDVEQTEDISYAQAYGNSVVQISSRFSNENVATSFYVYAIGVFAKTAGGSDTLIAVCTAVTPDEQEAASGTSLSAHIYNIQMYIANVTQLTMTVNSAGAASVADLQLLRNTLITEINLKCDISTLQALDTPVNITIATTDWTASGSNWVCTKSCAKATTDAHCLIELIPPNPSTLTATELRNLWKNLSYIYPRPALGAGTITFTASTKPSISLTFAAIGGAVS